jgi:hypothetical protein
MEMAGIQSLGQGKGRPRPAEAGAIVPSVEGVGAWQMPAHGSLGTRGRGAPRNIWGIERPLQGPKNLRYYCVIYHLCPRPEKKC